jgi:hypothetical protein
MRKIDPSQSALAFRSDRKVAVRVLVASAADPRGTSALVDLTPYSSPNYACGERNLDWVKSLDGISEDAGNQVAQATLTLHRELFDITIAPGLPSLVQPDIVRPEDAAIWGRRRIRILTQLLPDLGRADPNGHWDNVFEGYIEKIEPGRVEANELKLTCLDLASAYQQYQITDEQPPPSTPANVADGRPTSWFTALIGPEDGAYPLWTTTEEDETGFYDLLIANTFWKDLTGSTSGAPTIYNPTDLDYAAFLWGTDDLQDVTAAMGHEGQPFVPRQALLQTLRDAAEQIGWDLRLYWSDDVDRPGWQLTLRWPPRSYAGASLPNGQPEGPRFELTPDQYDIQSDVYDWSTLRNKTRVPYLDTLLNVDQSGAVNAFGDWQEDAESEARYGIDAYETTGDATGNLQSSDQANKTAQTILNDLSHPWRTLAIDAIYLPFVQLGDCIRLKGPTRNFASDIWVSVAGFSHKANDKGAGTSLTVKQIWVQATVDDAQVTAPFGTAPDGTPSGTPPLILPPVLGGPVNSNNAAPGHHSRNIWERRALAGIAPVKDSNWDQKRGRSKYFRAHAQSSGQVFTPSTGLRGIIFDSRDIDSMVTGGCLNRSSMTLDATTYPAGTVFVVPRSGLYRVSAKVRIELAADQAGIDEVPVQMGIGIWQNFTTSGSFQPQVTKAATDIGLGHAGDHFDLEVPACEFHLRGGDKLAVQLSIIGSTANVDIAQGLDLTRWAIERIS